MFADYSKSLYSLSLDSLTTIEFVLSLEFGQLPQNTIYEVSSIDALADYLLHAVKNEQVQGTIDIRHYKETEDIIDKYIDLMKTYNQRRIMTSKISPSDFHNSTEGERVVMITGANGSLGSQILLQLISKPQVSRIYCLLRGENATDRLRHAMEARAQDSEVLRDTKRIVVLEMDLNHHMLGQTQAMYNQLQNEVTDIIHSAWKMDFNMNIKDFDQDCLQGLYQLLKFASSSTTRLPMRFHFISSISSAASGLFDAIKEEPLPRRAEIALAHGYGQSKYAGEHICWAAMDLWGVPVDIYRFGQISGDSQTGIWNTTEMIPLMICAGGGELGVLPDIFQRVDWIPVNYGAACAVDIAIDTSTRTASPSERIHHILNPNVISWPQLLEHLKSCGLQFTVVSFKVWLRILLANPKNPAYVLAGFFEKIFPDDKQLDFPKFKMQKTSRRTATLECCSPIDHELVQSYLNYWWKTNFLKQRYTPTF